jgi:hypothetical protein
MSRASHCGGRCRRSRSRVPRARSEDAGARPPRRVGRGRWRGAVLRSTGRCRGECGRVGRRDRRHAGRCRSHRRAPPRCRGGPEARDGARVRHRRCLGTPLVRRVMWATRRADRSSSPVAPRRRVTRHPVFDRSSGARRRRCCGSRTAAPRSRGSRGASAGTGAAEAPLR